MQNFRWTTLLLALLLPSGALADGPRALSELRAKDLFGCFAVAPDGSKMACINSERGETFVEVKGTVNRRVYKTWPVGIAGTADDASSTSPEKVKSILRWLDKKGFVPAQVATRTAAGLALPGAACSLLLDEEGSAVLTRRGPADKGRPWVLVDAHGGKSALSALSADPAHNKAILVLDHTTASGDATIREFMLLPLDDLLGRAECKPEAGGASQ